MIKILWILLMTFIISLISFVGAITLILSEKLLKRLLLVLVGFAAGALIGGAFFHLLPEAIEAETLGSETVFSFLVLGFVLFLILEKLLWRHCHDRACPIHTFAYLNLLGDGVHNFIDGLIIAGSFAVSIPLGLTSSFAVAAHEIPQEMGDFGVIVYGGIKPRRALFLNFLSALTAVAGGLAGYFFLPYLGDVKVLLLSFAAGGFLYIAASDLVPELHKETDKFNTIVSFSLFLLGLLLMGILRFVFHH